MADIFKTKKAEYNGMQLWHNPVDNMVYATERAPKNGFSEAGGYAIYDFNAHFNGQKLAKESLGNNSYIYDAFVDSEFKNLAEEYISNVKAGGRQRMAALRSSTNAAVDIVNVWETVLGKEEREFAGKNLAKEIAVPNLLISIDTALKFGGMTELDEGQLGQLKELTYTRQNFEAKKYGLKFVIHEEAQLKNVHNVLQDSIQVATTKIDQKESFDVVNAATTLSAQAAIGNWQTFNANNDHSANNPLIDLGIAKLNIEGTSVGGKFNRVGMHPLDFAKYNGNTFIRGNATDSPVKTKFEPGTIELPGFPGVGCVLENSIQQGVVYCVDTEKQPTIALFKGPQRIGSAHDEETGDDKYFIVSYHLAAKIFAGSGRQITGATTPVAWS